MKLKMENTIKHKGLTDIEIYANWKPVHPEGDKFTADDVLRAYQVGKDKSKADIEKKIGAGIDKSGKATKKVMKLLNTINFHPWAAYLRIENPDSYSVLITLPDEEFCTDEMVKVYYNIAEVENKFSNNSFDIDFSICGTEKSIFDEEAVYSDGYYYKYRV